MIEKITVESFVRAMRLTERSPHHSLTSWCDKQIYRDAESLGLVYRLSHTQINWTERGMAFISEDEEHLQEIFSQIKTEETGQAARLRAVENFSHLTSREDAKLCREETARDERRKIAELLAKIDRVKSSIYDHGKEHYIEKIGKGGRGRLSHWQVEVEGSRNPTPFKLKRDAVLAVRLQLLSWVQLLGSLTESREREDREEILRQDRAHEMGL